MSNVDEELGFTDLNDSDFMTQEELEMLESEGGISHFDEVEGSEDPFEYQEPVAYEPEGFTGDVTPSVFVSKTYPHFEIVDTRDMNGLKLKVLENMLKGFSGDNKEYPVYLTINGDLLQIGMVQDYQVRALIKSLGIETLVARLTENKKIEGYMLYTLAK